MLDCLFDHLEDFRLYLVSFWPGLYQVTSDLSPERWPEHLSTINSRLFTFVQRQNLPSRVLIITSIVLLLIFLVVRIWYRWSMGVCRSKARLDGRTALITGANNGIGKETALDLASRGARVVLACRNMQSGMDALQDILEATSNRDLLVRKLDLASIKSVRQLASEVLENEERLDILVLNAGIAVDKKYLTEDNLELHMASNHFGHFLLTNLLAPLMVRSAKSNDGKSNKSNKNDRNNKGRIVVVSSLAHKWGKIQLDNLNSERNYDQNYIYSTSKLANVLFTKELAKRLTPHNILSNCLHPGAVQTGLFRHIGMLGSVFTFLMAMCCKSAKEGAQTSIYLSVDEGVTTSGDYYSDCKRAKVCRAAEDEKLAADLWDKSVEITGMEADEEIAQR